VTALVDPQGNFGSIDGDPPAAMRYTEARMTQAAMDMLADLKYDTVDFQPNYDDRLQEPTVLPGKFPNSADQRHCRHRRGHGHQPGPHNPHEILDSIDPRDREAGDHSHSDRLMSESRRGMIVRRGVKGPDFPTGGVICGRGGVVEAYATGRGKISVRGAAIRGIGKPATASRSSSTPSPTCSRRARWWSAS
jgi:DNA gyrase subunit A